MFQYFVKESSINAFKVDVMTNAFNMLINTLKCDHTHFELKHDKVNNEYNVNLNGIEIYSISMNDDLISIKSWYIYNSYHIRFNDLYNITRFGFIINVENYNKLNDSVNSFINFMNKNMLNVYLHGYIRELKSNHKIEIIDGWNTNIAISINIKYKFKSKLVDSRFCVVYNKECNTVISDTISSDSSVEHAREVIESLVSKADSKINALYARYDNIKETIGGVTINLDDIIILCHRGFKPLIAGGFITYKCPYTMGMISLKSSKFDCVIVNGLDEVYGKEDSIVYIGNN